MDNVIQHISNFDINDWFIGFLLGVLITALVYILRDIFMAPLIARKILKNNRDTLGNGYGRHLADVFIESWYKEPHMNEMRKYMVFTMHSPNSTHTINQMVRVQAEELEKLKLVEIKEGKINAIKNFRNKIVFFIVIYFLITFVGDNKKYYKDIKK
jgi:hypothetical protein